MKVAYDRCTDTLSVILRYPAYCAGVRVNPDLGT